jgi:acetyl-CoA carboxylase biotin carboxyl carrier protein
MESDDEAQTLKELLALMQEHDLDRLKVKRGDAIYEIVRREPGTVTRSAAPAEQPAPNAAEAERIVAGPRVKKIVAPLTGVFYRSASPDSAPYVDVGQRVDIGETVCILEAMKLFNEIQSDYMGTIVRIMPENGELVSQGEELFWIEAP